jgi:hypothetical protein
VGWRRGGVVADGFEGKEEDGSGGEQAEEAESRDFGEGAGTWDSGTCCVCLWSVISACA